MGDRNIVRTCVGRERSGVEMPLRTPSGKLTKLGHFERDVEAGSLPGGKNFIARAIKRPGQLHGDLGVKQGKKIPAAKLAAAALSDGTAGVRVHRRPNTTAGMQMAPTEPACDTARQFEFERYMSGT